MEGTERGEGGPPNNYCLNATAFGCHYSQCSTVCYSSPQLGHLGSIFGVELIAVSLEEGCAQLESGRGERRRVVLTGSPSVTTILPPPLSVPAVANSTYS